ncbi:FtsW/RodA/SpoVE family cell cycle protein [Mycetocola spongiae]|uniref:FtsW/RodA/SpoVE family cell cycle protein n=1 Tax=Mycetocola spongiae TaxID=2859226 RepID=UPI001CF4142B|nr:FtsW/RodA/SpoVE family cell cycle protein [Mycetocola spongiae]UCR90587.1 FtsW/RodA/SpoVE family cell cycle protein [Mycetocola spongiae]
MRKLRLPKAHRNRELALLIFACLVNGAALVTVQLGAIGRVDATVLYLCAGLAALVIGLHVCLRFVARDADPILLPVATVLNGLGVAMIYRIDLSRGASGWAAASTRQITWSALAIIAAIALILIMRNHRVLFRYTYIFGLLAFVLLLLPLIPGLGKSVGGARVWISIGDSLNFQPGEIAKIALAIFFAGYLVRTRDTLALVGKKFLGIRLPRLRDLGPIFVVWALSMGIIVFQHDLGTALLYFGMFTIMIYVSTGRLSWVLIGLALFFGGAFFAAQNLSYVHSRFESWLNPFSQENYEKVGGSWQLVQGIFGLAHGGLTGTGLGQGQPTVTALSESDFIITSLGEELGLAGLFAILALFLVIVARGLRIGFSTRDDFGKLLAVGLAFTIALQVFIMVGGVTRVIPLTGLATPFLAAGGSALVANWIIVALLLKLSDGVKPEVEVKTDA